MEILLTVAQVAAKLGVSRAQVYRLILHHGLPAVRLSERTQRFREADVDAWLDSRSLEGRAAS
jgi:excisionase family DNA binding protein